MLLEQKLERCKAAATPFINMKVPQPQSPVDEETHSRCRRSVGQLMWLISVRPDLSYAIKELSRHSLAPTPIRVLAVKRCLKHLKGTARQVYNLSSASSRDDGYSTSADSSHVLVVWTDSNWASPKSTSGSKIVWNGATLECSSPTQPVPALSTAEAEIIASNEAVLIQHLLDQIQKGPTHIEVRCDASAAVAFSNRLGLGKLRRMELKELWLQR
jgi:hypothetical protein